ncbi:MAG: DUF4156 domain-containing protein [Sandaracinaceae bacterium]
MTRTIIAASLLMLLPACGAGVAGLNPGAERVEWHSQRPEGNLQMVGDLQCQRGQNFRDPGSNVTDCRNTLRNEAAAMGAEVLVVSTEQIGMGDCANCVLMSGTAYRR